MWLATGRVGADLSKTISKKVLEIVLDKEILAPSNIFDYFAVISDIAKNLDNR